MVSRTTKRTFIQDTTLVGAGSSTDVDYVITADKVNCSNIWFSMSIEPENQDANAQGSWILHFINYSDVGVNFNDTLLNDEPEAGLIIAAGVWGATNQTPFNLNLSAGKVSRNIRKDGRLRLQVQQTGISAGNSSFRGLLICNVTTL